MIRRPPSRLEIVIIFMMLITSSSGAYLLYKLNPVFMSKMALAEKLTDAKESLISFPDVREQKDDFEPDLESIFLANINNARNHHYSEQFVIKHSFIRNFSKPFTVAANSDKAPLWSLDQFNIYYSFENQIYVESLEGEFAWSFKTSQGHFVDRPLVTEKSLYVVTDKGELTRLNKSNGQLIWTLPLQEEALHAPIIYRDALFLLTKKNSDVGLMKINGHNAKVIWRKATLSLQNPNAITVNRSKNLLLITDPAGILLAIDAHSGNAYWQKKDLGSLKAPAMTNGQFIYLANAEAQAFSLNITSKTTAWEYTLKSGASSVFAYVPEFRSVCILTDNGYLHCIEALTGEGQWFYNTGNTSPNQQVIAVRLHSSSWSKFEVTSKYKYWSIWAPCRKTRLCIFLPDKGRLLTSINLRGELDSNPIFVNQDLYLGLKDPQKLPWNKGPEPAPPVSLAKFSLYKAKPRPASEPEK